MAAKYFILAICRTDKKMPDGERSDGLKLRGYLYGLPAYREIAGMYSEVDSLKLKTLLGSQYAS